MRNMMGKNLIHRVHKRISDTKKAFRSDCCFSFWYACLRVLDELGGRIGMKKISAWAHERKDRWIQNYLKQDILLVIEKYTDNLDYGSPDPNAPIWVCWWSGLNYAPELVRICVESTYQNAGNHPVHLITEETYQNYLEIPGYMLEKVESGKMGFAHLADYIRVKLLADYGGLWLDATIFCSGRIPDICFDLPVFTCKGPVRKGHYLSDYRWVTFCLGGWRENVFYRILAEVFETYWSKNKYAVDYLFFDHIILSIYEQHPVVRKLLDDIPDNNIHRDDLQAAMNAALPAKEFGRVLHEDTVLYKLSWREIYSEFTEDNSDSIFRYFLQMGREWSGLTSGAN